jgi:predicted protein tyrosine phosphatase
MNKVIVVSRENARKMASRYQNCMLISIESPSGGYETDPINLYEKGIKVYFDDIIALPNPADVEDGRELRLMDEKQAETVVEFISNNSPNDFVIHCDAGMSRSIAVGSFMEQFFDYQVTYNETGHDQFKNIHVFNLLRKNLWGV